MHTIALQLSAGITLVAQRLSSVHPAATAHLPAQASNGIGLALVAIVIVIMAITSAARRVSSLLTNILQLVATITSAIFTIVIVAMIATVLLIYK